MRSVLTTLLKPGLIALLVAMMAIPLAVGGNRYIAFVVGVTMINLLWAAGMNLLNGYAGLVPLSYAGIAGISAYLTVALTLRWHWSFWLAMPLSAVAAAVVGVALGLPSLRLKGFYFALSSLVIQTVLTLCFVYFVDLTNGDTGVGQIAPPDIPFVAGGAITGVAFDLTVALIAFVGVAAVAALAAGPFGQRLISIREDEELAEAIGIDVTSTKLTAFFIGSLYAGIGGALYASYVGFISPRAFDLLTSLNIWLMVAFGGRGTIWGPIIGTLVLAPVPFLLQSLDTLKDVIYGTLIIAVIVAMPGGVWGALADRAMAWRRGRRPAAAAVATDGGAS